MPIILSAFQRKVCRYPDRTARFTTIIKENWDHLCGAMAFNIKRVAISMRKQEMIAAT
jgi:hypothetical protein